jgi:replicative DNA helicase
MSKETPESSQLIFYDLETEQELIGFLLLNNKNIDNLAHIITPEHFYYQNHQIIYRSTAELINKNHQANEKTIFYELENKNLFPKKEELKSYLELLVNSTAGSLNDVKSLIKIINELYLKRSLNNIRNNINSHLLEQDIQSAISKTEEEIYKIRNKNAKNETKSIKDINKTVLEKLKNAKNSAKEFFGLRTNLTKLDIHLGGLQKSDLIIVAARPSMGKTALAITIAKNIARNILKNQHSSEEDENDKSGGVAFFSLEMSSEQICSRIISMESGFSTKSIHTARKDDEKTGEKNVKLNDNEFQKIVESIIELEDVPLYIDDTPSISTSYLKTRARYLKRKYNIQAIFVDYLQLMTSGSNKFMSNRVQEISEITQSLKAIAKELEIPVIALSQLSRAVEMAGRNDKKPKLSDLRESGSIEQDADIVAFLYRESYYLEREINIDDKDSGSEKEDNEDQKSINKKKRANNGQI